MPLKRKARLLFVSPHGRFRAPVAAALASQIGASMCEARWASPAQETLSTQARNLLAQQELGSPDSFRLAWTPEAMRWADTVFVLESQENEVAVNVPAGVQLRRYLIPYCASADDCAEVFIRIDARVHGIIGGLQMLNN